MGQIVKLMVAAGVWLALVSGARSQTSTNNQVLILYDSAGQYGWIGGLHARMLANLMGHFQLGYQIAPVENYAGGEMNLYRATFYLGTVFGNPLPAAFQQDALSSARPICWFKYNLEQIGGLQFESKTGFRFDSMDWSGYAAINYKGESFAKNQLDAELGRVTILDPNLASAAATACKTNSEECVPYVVRARNFWYVADTPFSFISEEDRYIVFSDLLHDILQVTHPESHQAIIRIEDIDPTYPPELLQTVADYLKGADVPFAVSVIPVYNDPLGYYNQGVPEQVRLSQTPGFIGALEYVVAQGGQIVLEGYTHQYDSVVNPFTGVSGDDYEFWRVTTDANTNVVDYLAVPEDSAEWALGRVTTALGELQRAGVPAVAWQTPHYAASAVDSQVFGTNFPLTLQRALYFDDSGHVAGQFFPYPIERDIYGQKIMPENIGNVDPNPWFNYPPRLPADLIRAAKKNLVVRDGWASGYFHAFLDLSYLQEVVEGIRALGYTYVPVAPSGPPLITFQPQGQSIEAGAQVTFGVAAIGSEPLSYQWRRDGDSLEGATAATLTLTNLQLAQAGTYSVIVSNDLGRAVSSNAPLSVLSTARILSAGWSGNAFSLWFQSQTGQLYRFEYKTGLDAGLWQSITTMTGDGNVLRAGDAWATNQSRFYRVWIE